MKAKKLYSFSQIIILGFLLVYIQACSKEEATIPETPAPVIPPESTMIIDFSEFPDTSGLILLKILDDNRFSTRSNWGWAALNVAVWNSILTLTLAVPVAAFSESFNHQPVQQPDGSWLWTYDVTVGGVKHTAKLFGTNVTDGVEWKMLLTKDGFYNDFEWFTGFSNLPVTEGNWTINLNPDQPASFLLIEWSRNIEQNTAEVKYTNILEGDPGNGSYIFYGKTNDSPYNRFYDIYGAQEDNLTNMQWSYEFLFGQIKDQNHFGDDLWHCWDEKLFDIECP